MLLGRRGAHGGALSQPGIIFYGFADEDFWNRFCQPFSLGSQRIVDGGLYSLKRWAFSQRLSKSTVDGSRSTVLLPRRC